MATGSARVEPVVQTALRPPIAVQLLGCKPAIHTEAA